MSVLNSTAGSLSSRFYLVTSNTTGGSDGGAYIGRGVYTVGANDKGLDTINAQVALWVGSAYSISPNSSTQATGNPFVFQTSGGWRRRQYDPNGANYQYGVVSAYGSGSMTITWTKVGSPTGTFIETIRCFK